MARMVRLVLDVCPPRQVWCDGCMTSARFVCNVVQLKDDGVRLVSTASKCAVCDGLQ